jgi:polysaccharide biosynthesis protein VpsQ
MPIFHRLIPVAAFSFFIFIIWIIVVSDSGSSNVLIDSIRAIPYGDKLGHMSLYAVLAALVNLSLKPRKQRYLGLPLGCALVLLFALLEELSQGFFPSTRTLDIQDAVADCVGVYFVALIDAKLFKSQTLGNLKL